MLPARRVAPAVTALLPFAGAFFVLLFSLFPAAGARAQSPSGGCADAAGLAVLSTPVAPWQGMPLRVIVTVSGTDMTIDLTKSSLERKGGMNARTLAAPYIAYKGITGPLEPGDEMLFVALPESEPAIRKAVCAG